MVATIGVVNNYTIFVRLTCGFDAHWHIKHQSRVLFLCQKLRQIKKEKENKQMAVIIKLNGVTIGATTMTTNEIRNAKNAGFTILTRKEGR